MNAIRNTLSAAFVLFIIFLSTWAASSWYFGAKAEQKFRLFLQQSTQVVGKRLVRFELLSYEKTISGAKAQLGISSDSPMLNERMGNLQMKVNLLNGPLFITRSGISLGSSRWSLQLNSGVKDGANDVIPIYEDFFPHGLPSAIVRVDFNELAHYASKGETDISAFLITGVFNLKTEDNRGAITLKDLNLGIPPGNISAKKIKISYQHQKAITATYKPGTAALQVSSLTLNHKLLSDSLVLDVKINSDISLKKSLIRGFIKADINNVNTKNIPVETAEISMLFKDLPVEALIIFSEANDELNNLHQQAQWVLEEQGEVPEGQDQIWALYDQIESSSDAFPELMVEKISSSHNQLIQLKANTSYKGVSSQLEGDANLNSKNPKLSSWLSLLEGEAQVKLDQYLFDVIQRLLPIKNPDFKLLLRDNKLLMVESAPD